MGPNTGGMMPDKELVTIRKKLDALLKTINKKSHDFKKQVRYDDEANKKIEEAWRGNGLLITAAPEDEWDDTYIWVSTPNAQSLAWVVRQIRDIFDNRLGVDKYDFYVLLGKAANAYQNQNKNFETELGIATAVIAEAYKFLKEWEEDAGRKPSYYRA
jgi:hypothetical protein